MTDSGAVRTLALRAACTWAVWAMCTQVSLGQANPYTPKNGILSWKAVLIGGGFRVTTAIPFRGNLSKYGRLEIVKTESLIGTDVPSELLEQLTRGLAAAFHKGARFALIEVVEGIRLPSEHQALADAPAVAESFRDADPIDAPMRAREDMELFDRQRQAAARAPEQAPSSTLVVRCQVIDFSKGNKFLQLLFIDLGNSVLTLRCSYFDKSSGEELGRSVISSDNSSKAIPSALTSRTALTGVIDGLVDQVTRRKIAGER